MCTPYAGREDLVSVRKLFSEVGSKQRCVQALAVAHDSGVYRQHGGESGDVVVPENTFDLGQVGFAEERTVSGRPEIHSADFDIERIFLGSDDEVGADRAELAVNLVTDVGSDRDHGCGNGHTERDGGSS